MIVDKRAAIYNEIRSNCDVTTDCGIYLDLKIEDEDCLQLKTAVNHYIMTTLKSFFKEKIFHYDDYLINHKEEILSLPNRTPNGALYPKIESVKEYNEVQSVLNDILVKTNLMNHLKSYDICTVRIVEGVGHTHDIRPTSTTKLHSDAWPGHDGDAIVSIGLLGDESTSLETIASLQQ